MAYYLVDFENVHSQGISGAELLCGDDSVYIFYTSNSNSLTFDAMKQLNSSTAEIKLFHVTCGGRNALDFQLSSFMGYIIARDDEADIRIISKDAGFGFVKSFWEKNFEKKARISLYPCIRRAISGEIAITAVTGLSLPELTEESAQVTEVTFEVPSAEDILSPQVHAEQSQIAAADCSSAEEVISEPQEEPSQTPAKKKRGRKKKSESSEPAADKNDPIDDIIRAAGITSDGEIAKIRELVLNAKDKQQFYRSITKNFGMEEGLKYYKALRPEYTNMCAIAEKEK